MDLKNLIYSKLKEKSCKVIKILDVDTKIVNDQQKIKIKQKEKNSDVRKFSFNDRYYLYAKRIFSSQIEEEQCKR